MEDKVNINLSGIQLLMKLADFCAQHPDSVDASHWSWLLLQFREVSYDARPEVSRCPANGFPFVCITS